jgi:prephenate dehydratase
MIENLQSRVAFQGEPGAYSEGAAYLYFNGQVLTLPCENFDDVFLAVTQGNADYGILPIENSLAGSIHRNYDLMLRHQFPIQGEYHLRVSHCLLALKEVDLDELIRVHSHPQALAQCEASLKRLGLKSVAEADTAGSARLIKELGAREAAAIASRRAAEVYDLQILVENLEDNPENFTRFLVLGQERVRGQGVSDGEYKTSVVFTLDNHPGALFKALSVFALREIDLTKIESRPLAGRPWEYLFYIDFAGHADSPSCERALAHLGEMAPFLRVLGSYPRHGIADEPAAPAKLPT